MGPGYTDPQLLPHGQFTFNMLQQLGIRSPGSLPAAPQAAHSSHCMMFKIWVSTLGKNASLYALQEERTTKESTVRKKSWNKFPVGGLGSFVVLNQAMFNQSSCRAFAIENI